MNELESYIYLISSAVCITLGIVVLAIVKDYGKAARPYSHAIRFLVAGIFCRALMMGGSFAVEYWQLSSVEIDTFFVPVMYGLEVCLFTFSVLALMQSAKVTRRNVLKFLLPLSILIPIYMFCLLLSDGSAWTASPDMAFVVTRLSLFVCLFLYLTLATEWVLCFRWIRKEAALHFYIMANSVPFGDFEDGWKIDRLAKWFIPYFILAGVVLAVPNKTVNAVLSLVCTSALLVLSIAMLNLQGAYYLVAPAIEKKIENDNKHN